MREKYWAKAKDNKEKAKEQIAFINKNYSKETKETVEQTKIYSGPLIGIDWTDNNFIETHSVSSLRSRYSKYFLLDMDTISALFYIKNNLQDIDSQITILNFASFTNPGGKFIEGSNAQEECLCHNSNLYNVLKEFGDSYYKKNRNHIAINRQLYSDRAIYSPNIIFNTNDKKTFVTANVITCAAPFWRAAQEKGVEAIENQLVFAQRIEFIRKIAEWYNTDIFILGAWGCGVFGQDPELVASLFNYIFSRTSIRTIVFAVPSSLNPENYEAFDKCIKSREI